MIREVLDWLRERVGYRWLGAIGYVLLLFPHANILGCILLGLGWLFLGERFGVGKFRALGLMIMGLFVPIVIFDLYILPLMPVIMAPLIAPIMGPAILGPEVMWFIRTMLAVTALVGIYGVAVTYFHATSLWDAYRMFGIKDLNRAGWLLLISASSVVAAALVMWPILTGLPLAIDAWYALRILAGIGAFALGVITYAIFTWMGAVGFLKLPR